MFNRARLYLMILLLVPGMAAAAWTGIAAFVGEGESDWRFDGDFQKATHRYYGLRIEEKSDVDLRIGASAGQFSLRLRDPLDLSSSEKFDGQFLSIYLRWPINLTDNLKLHSLFNYQFNSANSFSDTGLEDDEIDWTELSLRFGLGLDIGRLSIQPFMLLRSIDGDVTSSGLTQSFELADDQNYGLILDYRLEPNAYIRLASGLQDRNSFYLGLVSEY